MKLAYTQPCLDRMGHHVCPLIFDRSCSQNSLSIVFHLVQLSLSNGHRVSDFHWDIATVHVFEGAKLVAIQYISHTLNSAKVITTEIAISTKMEFAFFTCML